MAQVIAVRNLPMVENAVELWEKHNLDADDMGLPGDDCACLVAILAIDRGYDRDVHVEGMYDFVAETYGIAREDVDAVEWGFMGGERDKDVDLGYYEYGKEIARRVL